MTETDILENLVDRSVLGLTLWGEARGESVDGRLAVGGVIRNRLTNPARYSAKAATWKAVCLAPSQFSCWNANQDDNHAALMAHADAIVSGLPVSDVDLSECLFLADGLIQGVFRDRSGGATFYLERLLYTKDPPRWAQYTTVTVTIGRHVFLKELLKS